MKKKPLFILLITAIIGLVLSLNFPKEVKATTTNGFRVEQVFQDKFNKETLDPSWTLNGATQELNYNGLHCISPVSYGAGPIINAVRLADRTQINFTIYPQSGESASNISFNIGMETPASPQKEPDVDCKVQFWNDQLVFTDWQHNLAVNHDKEQEHVLRGFNGLYSDLLRTDVSLFIERKNETTTQIYAEYSRDGEVIYSSRTQAFELKNPRCPYGYCGFFWDVVEMDLTNFEVYNNDELVFSDDLSENTLTYPSTDPALGNFHINTTLNESNCYISRVTSVKMDSLNESIINSHTLTKLENVSYPYELKYSIKSNGLKDNSFFGFGFGLSANNSSLDETNAIGFIKNDNLTAEVVILKNGVIDRSNNYQVSLTKLGNGRYIDYTVSFDSLNNAYLTFSGLTYKFANINYLGNIGIGLVSLSDGTESSSVELREFSLKRNVYNKHLSEDASNDFSGVKVPDESDPFYTEPYINNQKYFLGSGVSLEEDWTTGDASLTFTNVGPYSGFGYCKEYTEWVLEFDIELFTRQNNQMFGISFGRKSIVDVLLQASQSSNAYLFRCETPNTSQLTYGAQCKFDDGSTYKLNSVNLFDASQNKYHMMFIGKNRTLYVYYKAIDAPDSELGILRAQINNVNIDGYVSIVGNNNISFGISNYKIVNLSDDYKESSALTLRESFDSKESMSSTLELDPMSKIQNEKLVMNDSTLNTKEEHLYEIIRFTTYEIENNLQVMFSKNKKVIFDVTKNQIIIKEGSLQTAYDVSDVNLKYLKGKRFEIIIMGDEINIGYKGYYDPYDKLSSTIVSHKLTSSLSKDTITLSANGKVTIDDLYIFSLDNSKKCETFNYEDDPNDATVWNVKPDFDASKVYKPDENKEEEPKKGCKSSINASLLVLSLGAFIPVLVYKKKKVK